MAGGGSGGASGGTVVAGGGGGGGFREDKSPVTPYTASPLEGAGQQYQLQQQDFQLQLVLVELAQRPGGGG